MAYTYQYKLLKIDLTTKKVDVEIIAEQDSFDYIGGRGLGAKLLWDRQKAGIDPLSAENPLLLLTGPLTGTTPSGAHICVMGKSPKTGRTIMHALTAAQFAVELKFAGYDGLYITGKCDSLCYLYINDDVVEIRDAGSYKGLDCFETPRKLKEEVQDISSRVLCIGPAGENLAPSASIQQEGFRSAARGGPGALMGSKNLKAIVCRGHKPLEVPNPEKFFELREIFRSRMTNSCKTSRKGYNFGRYGSIAGQISTHDVEELNVKNYREASWPDVDRVSGVVFERRLKVKSRGCFSCPMGCMQVGILREDPWDGKLVNPDFDSSGTIGPGLLLQNCDEMAYISRLGDQYGVDDASLGNIIGFIMECYEKGLLTKEDIGCEARWGNVHDAEKLVEMIVYRKGFGELASCGVEAMAKHIGKGSSSFAMHAKGLEYAGYAPQAHHDRALQYAVGDRGGCHHFGLSVPDQNMRVLADSFVVCTWDVSFMTPDMFMDMLSAATGYDYQHSDWTRLAVKMGTLSRCYNIREGMIPFADDILPDRMHDEPLSYGKKQGACYTREKFVADRGEWYAQRGCDEEGVPTEATMKEQGLDFCIDTIKEVRNNWGPVENKYALK